MTGNIFYEHMMKAVEDLTAKRQEMEQNFSRSNRQEYDRICEMQVKDAIELIKMGVEYSEAESGIISIVLSNGNHAEIIKKELMEYMSPEQFSLFFPLQMDECIDVQEPTDKAGEDLIQNTMMNALNNPFAAFMASLFSQIGNMQQAISPFGGQDTHKTEEQQRFLTEKIAILTKEKDNSLKELEKTKAECEKYKNLVSETSDNNNKSSEKINELTDALKQKESEVEAKKTQLENIEKTIDELSALRGEYEKEICRLKESSKEKDDMMESLRKDLAQIGDLEEANAKLQKDLSDALAEKAETSTFAYELISEEDALRQKVESLTNEITSVTQRLTASEGQLEERNKTFSDLTGRIEEYKREAAANATTISQLREDLSHNSEIITAVKTKLESSEEENERLKGEIEEYKSTLDDVKDQLYASIEKIKSLDEVIAQKNHEINVLKQKSDESARLQKENEDLKESIGQLRAEKEDSEREYETLREENETLFNVAFVDEKFKVNNEAAFLKIIEANENRYSSIIAFDICDMTEINATYSETAGDTVISISINYLKATFGENVFRIRGGQFAVLSEDSFKNALLKAQKLERMLRDEKDIIIIAGVQDATHNDLSLKDAWEKAKAYIVKKSHSRKFSKQKMSQQEQHNETSPVDDDMDEYEEESTEPSYEAANDSSDDDDIYADNDLYDEDADTTEIVDNEDADVQCVNPNISADLLKYACDDDDDDEDVAIVEQDSTQLDMMQQMFGDMDI